MSTNGAYLECPACGHDLVEHGLAGASMGCLYSSGRRVWERCGCLVTRRKIQEHHAATSGRAS